LGYLVRMFCEKYAPGKVPDELAFAWGRGRGDMHRRNPCRGIYRFPELKYGYPKLHLENNIRANWLLRGILDSTESKFNTLDKDLQLTALQSALFMIGYDVKGQNIDRPRALEQRGKILQFGKDERGELAEFLAVAAHTLLPQLDHTLLPTIYLALFGRAMNDHHPATLIQSGFAENSLAITTLTM